MKRGRYDILVPYGDDLGLHKTGRNHGTQNLYAIIDALHPRCPDEHRMYWAASDAIKIDIGLEGLNLTTEGVASYGDI